MSAPTGWVSLVFTDIQGSTALWERLGNAFQAALDVHDRTVRSAIAAHGGYEVKTEGDAFMIAFGDVNQAVAFCLDAQERLYHADWPESVLGDPVFRGLRVRMGVHVGDPLCRPDPVTGRMDYYGRMVNRAARIGAAGHGGQIVLSAAAYAAMTPVDAVVSDLGWHALRGFEGRERLWQLTPRRLAQHIFPPPRTLDVRRTNLPSQVSIFVGRGPEFQRMEKLLARGERLITLVGPGGAGKTRLALRAAGELLADFPGGVWCCDLSEARSVDGVCAAVAAGLGLHLVGADPVASIGETLASSERVLLVLDDADRLAPLAHDTLDRWLDSAPGAHFIVTSRAPVGRCGEEVIPLAPLPLPRSTSDANLRDNPAIALFLSRARAVHHEVTLDAATLPTLLDLVRLLRGLPLAVELAAARLAHVSVAELRDAVAPVLEDKETSEDVLESILAWAVTDLRPWERAAIEQLAPFAGGFTEEAADSVLRLDATPGAPPVMDVIAALADKALLRTLSDGRWLLTPSLAAWLDERGKSAQRLQAERRHAAWFAQLGQDYAIERLERNGTAEAWRGFLAERDNLLLATSRAVGWAREHPEAALVAARCCMAVLLVFDQRGPVSAGRAATMPVLRVTGIPAAVEARLLHRLARLERQAARTDEAASLLERARHMAREASDFRYEGIVLNALSVLQAEHGESERAHRTTERALKIHRREGNARHEGVAIGHLAELHHAAGNLAGAESGYREALAQLLRANDHRAGAVVLGLLGHALADQGRRGEARRCYEEALATHRKVGNERHEADVLLRLADLLADASHHEEAARQLEAALPLYRALGGPTGAARVHRSLGIVHADMGELSEARRHLDTAWRLLGESASAERSRVAIARAALAAREARVSDVARWLSVAGLPQTPEALACQAWLARRSGDEDTFRSLAALVADSGSRRAQGIVAKA